MRRPHKLVAATIRSRQNPPATSSAASRAKVAGLQETATIAEIGELASAAACRRAPARGGSNMAAA
jgi:hypothetical protein